MYVDCKYGRQKNEMLSSYFLYCYTTEDSIIFRIKFNENDTEKVRITAEHYLTLKAILKRYSQSKLKEVPSFKYKYSVNGQEFSGFVRVEKSKEYLTLIFEQEEKNTTLYIYLTDIECEIIADYMQIKQKEVV